MLDFKMVVSLLVKHVIPVSSSLSDFCALCLGQIKNTCVWGNLTLPKFTGET